MRPKLFPEAQSGMISPETVKKRPKVRLTPHEKATAKSLRDNGKNFSEIAHLLNRNLVDVEIALSTIRTKRVDPPRYTANISQAAHVKIREMSFPNEAVWQTVNRLFGLN